MDELVVLKSDVDKRFKLNLKKGDIMIKKTFYGTVMFKSVLGGYWLSQLNENDFTPFEWIDVKKNKE